MNIQQPAFTNIQQPAATNIQQPAVKTSRCYQQIPVAAKKQQLEGITTLNLRPIVKALGCKNISLLSHRTKHIYNPLEIIPGLL